MKTTLARSAPVIAAAVLAAAGLVLAGPLTPPAGPVTSTYKTLVEVEPRTPISAAYTPGDADSLYKITQPGSYYLTGNVAALPGKHGIEIAASGVTLDLSGFEVSGLPGGMGGVVDAVVGTVTGLTNVTIRNGSIRDWSGQGIDLYGISARNCTVEHIRVSGCADDGIRVGADSTVSDCTALANTQTGITAEASSRIVGCTSSHNSSFGIHVGNTVSIIDCKVAGNPVWGIAAGDGCSIQNCSLTDNGNSISVGDGGRISDCSATIDTPSGYTIRAASNTFISRVTIVGGGCGIWLDGGGNRVEGCRIGQTGSSGIYSNGGVDTIVNNTLTARVIGSGDGIVLPAPDTVVDGNTFFGFFIGIDANFLHQRSTIIRNRFGRCTYSGGAGGPMDAPFASTAAAATHPLANTAY